MRTPRAGAPSRRALAMLLLAGAPILAAPPAAAQWVPEGVSVAASPAKPAGVRIMADGRGGLFIGIGDDRDSGTSYDLYLQHLDANGYRSPGFPADGLPVSILPGSQGPGGLAPDGAGGILLYWRDIRPSPTMSDIYVQRVNPDGTLPPGWAVGGMPAALAPSSQYNSGSYYPGVTSDGAGGAYVAWNDYRNDSTAQQSDVYVQRLLADGTIAPGWPAEGRVACVAPLGRGVGTALLDDRGGVVVVMGDTRRGIPTPGDVDTYAQRFTPNGQLAPGWPAEGRLLIGGFGGAGGVVPDDAGGFYCLRGVPSSGGYLAELYVLRFTFDGELAPGWPAGGVLVFGGPGEECVDIQVERDGQGGIVLAWWGFRPGTEPDIYVARIRPDGTVPPGWPADGLRVSNPASYPYFDFDPAVTHDGAGGLYVAWCRHYDGSSPSYLQHVMADGTIAPGWPEYGHVVASTAVQTDPKLASDGDGGAFVVWQTAAYYEFRATRFAADGPVAASVSLARSEALADRIALEWRTGEPASFVATLERREREGEWHVLATLAPDGEGRLAYEDRAVEPDRRYGYRLSWDEAGARTSSAEVWLDMPGGPRLALHGFAPNPSPGSASVAFTLAGPGEARLEVLDVAGRRVAAREAGALGAGRHTLRLESQVPLAPGLYLLRLVTPGRTLTARGVVVR